MTLDLVTAIVIIIFLALIFTKVYRLFIKYKNSIYLKSKSNGHFYRVRNSKNKQEVADTLGEISNRIEKLILHLNKNKSTEFLEEITRLNTFYNRDTMIENVYLDATSYTIDKKETLICVVSRDNDEKVYDINILMFVCLHELAHIGNKTYGHEDDFVKLFVYLLKNAIDIGIYRYVNYRKFPQEYCGTTINDTPI